MKTLAHCFANGKRCSDLSNRHHALVDARTPRLVVELDADVVAGALDPAVSSRGLLLMTTADLCHLIDIWQFTVSPGEAPAGIVGLTSLLSGHSQSLFLGRRNDVDSENWAFECGTCLVSGFHHRRVANLIRAIDDEDADFRCAHDITGPIQRIATSIRVWPESSVSSERRQ